jgi:hypothetical protein
MRPEDEAETATGIRYVFSAGIAAMLQISSEVGSEW